VKSDEVEGETLKYLNRLSDFLFTLARHAAKIDGKAENIYVRPGWLQEVLKFKSLLTIFVE
jgi:cob(I)alamin adenosyltransferase